jgi:hypothetical protein
MKYLSLVFIPSYLKLLTIPQHSTTVARIMETLILTIFACIWLLSRDKNLHLENLALRQQLAILKHKNKHGRRSDSGTGFSGYFYPGFGKTGKVSSLL